jgi:hypothetical protein
MTEIRSASRRSAWLGLLAGGALLAAAPAALAGGGPWHGWRAAAWHRPVRTATRGWHAAPGGAWRGPFSPFPHAPAGNGFGVRNPYPGVQNFSYSRTVNLPGDRSATYGRTFARSGYGDYTYDRSVTGPGGHTASIDATQTYNPANGSYSRTVTDTGFNGKTATSVTDFNRTSRGNYAYSDTNTGPNGRVYSRSIDQTYNPANHELSRSSSTTLRNGQTANYATTVNNAGNGTYDYSASWNGFQGGSGSASGAYSR